MKTIIIALAFMLASFGQAITTPSLTLTAPPPPKVEIVSTRIVGNQGNATYYYWVVACYEIGCTQPTGPAVANKAPNTLSVSNYVQVNWNPIPDSALGGFLYYIVIRNTSPNLLNSCTGCAKIDPSTPFNDTGAVLVDNWTNSSVGSATTTCTLDNLTGATPSVTCSPYAFGTPNGVLGASNLTINKGSTYVEATGTLKQIPTPLLAYYTMEEGSGTTLVDHSGNGNDGTFVGTVTWDSNGGLTFGGTTSDYVSLPAALSANTSTRSIILSLEYNGDYFSVPLGNTSTLNGSIMMNWENGPTPSVFQAGGPVFSYVGPSGVHTWGFTLDSTTAANNKVYFDGVELPVLSQSVATLANAVLTLGTGTGFPFTGAIYSAAFSDTILSASDMALMHNLIESTLVARGVLTDRSMAGDDILWIMGDSIANSIANDLAPTNNPAKFVSAVSGTETSSVIQQAPGVAKRLQHDKTAGGSSIVLIWSGTNDIWAGKTGASTFNRLVVASAMLRAAGWKVVVTTCMDRGNGTNSAQQIALNNLLRSQWPLFFDALADPASNPLLGAVGASANPVYFSAETHLTAAGEALAAPYLDSAINSLGPNVGLAPGMGAALASAGTITPTNVIHHVTGVTTVSTIATTNLNLQTGDTLTLIPDGLWSTNTAGNIALATTGVVNKALILTYDTVTGKFYPSY